MKLLILISSIIFSFSLFATSHKTQVFFVFDHQNLNQNIIFRNHIFFENKVVKKRKKKKVRNKYLVIGKSVYKNPFHNSTNYSLIQEKFTSVIVIILTGPIGGHRLYLGTKPIVPIIYALTLGGGFGILPLVDLIYIISAKDIENLKNNDKIFMWID